MSAKPQIIGIDGIMDWFDRYATSPYYAVYTFLSPSKLDKAFQYTKPDIDEGRMLLEQTLMAMQQQDDQILYCIKLYDGLNKKSSLDTNMDHYASVRFRVSELPVHSMQQISGVERPNYKLESAMAKMMETQNMILSKLSADELEEEVPEQKNFLAGLLDSPHMQTLLIAGVSKLLGINGMEQTQNVSLAGIEDSDPNEAIELLGSLMNKGVTVDHLRKLNDMSNAKLQSLLIML